MAFSLVLEYDLTVEYALEVINFKRIRGTAF